MKKQLIALISMGLSYSLFAGIPTASDFNALDLSSCPPDVGVGAYYIATAGEDGAFEKQPEFLLVGQQVSVTVKKADKVYGFPSCLTGCSAHSRTMFYKSNPQSSSDFHAAQLPSGVVFQNVTNRTATLSYNTRGIGTMKSSTRFDYNAHANASSFTVCDTNYIFVQSKPVVGVLQSLGGQGLNSGLNQFSVTGGSMDTQYSKFAQQGNAVKYKWTVRALDAPFNYSKTTSSKTLSVNLPYGGEHVVKVRAFDGTYTSSPKTLYIYVNGPPYCNQGVCINPH